MASKWGIWIPKQKEWVSNSCADNEYDDRDETFSKKSEATAALDGMAFNAKHRATFEVKKYSGDCS